DPDLNLEMFRSFFVHPPTPDVSGDRGVKWIAGDVMRDAKTRFLTRVLGGNLVNLRWCGYDCKPPYLGTNSNAYEAYSYCLLGDPALRMDPGAANYIVTQNGAPADAFGYFRGGSPADSVNLEAVIQSPVGIDSAWIEERGSDGTVRVVPRSDFIVARSATDSL